ncbi:MAG TPA: hypothetical protein VNO20_10725 [Solirubrobacterales bacterium]|nr:hypothetical protein [Solirubrobacterales bacterium]
MAVTQRELAFLGVAWLVTAAVRVILGSSTSLIAYALFGFLWLISGVLLIAAIRLLVIAKTREQKIEAFGICMAMAALLGQGIFGSDNTIAIATLVFFSSLIVLVCIYARRVRRRNPVEL